MNAPKNIGEVPKISHFDVTDYIDSGYWKDVWKATRKSNGSVWALKFLNKTETAAKQSLERRLTDSDIWLKEDLGGNTTAFANLAFHYVDKADNGEPFIAEEYIDRFLSDYLKESGKLSMNEILEIADGIAHGLSDLHTKIVRRTIGPDGSPEGKIGWIHGDLKTDNIGYTTQGIVKITDFGTATMGSHDRSNVGYLYTRSPENFLGKPSKASDVYSLGAIVYNMVTGRDLFEEEFAGMDPKEFIEKNYANRKTWNKLIDCKIEDVPKYLKRFFRKTLYHEEDRSADGAQACRDVTFAKRKYKDMTWPGRIKKYAYIATVALVSLVGAYSHFLDSKKSADEITKLTEEKNFQRKYLLAKSHIDKLRSLSYDNIFDELQLEGLEGFFGDKKSALLAFLYPEAAAEAYSATRSKNYDTLQTFILNKYTPGAKFDSEADPELSKTQINNLYSTYLDNWMVTSMSNTRDVMLKTRFTDKVAYYDSVAIAKRKLRNTVIEMPRTPWDVGSHKDTSKKPDVSLSPYIR